MKALHMVSFIILVVGGLNWLLFVFGWDVGTLVLGGSMSVASRVLYVVVGLAALSEIFTHKENCKTCTAKADSAPIQPMSGA